MSELIDFPTDVREYLKSIDLEIRFLNYVHRDVRTYKKMKKLKKYD